MADDPKKLVGLEQKFHVERLQPSSRGIDHTDCRYFVLDPQHDISARAALARYAQVCESEGFEALAADLRDWLNDLPVLDNADDPHGED